MKRACRGQETVNLGEICETIHNPVHFNKGEADGLAVHVISGKDLFREVLLREELSTANILERPSPRFALRKGDILIPTVSNRPRAVLIGEGLEGVYPHRSVMLLRPKTSGPTSGQIVDFLSSREFFDKLSQYANRLKNDVRISANDLVNLSFRVPLADDAPSSSVVVLVDRLARDLISLIAERREELREIEWRDLERVLATAFSGLGFEVELTPPSKDGGKDLVLHCAEQGTKKRYVVEVKHWVSGKRVGSSQLLKFVEVVMSENHDAGLFLSTSGFSRTAYKAEAHLEHRRVRLGGEDKVMRICQMFVAAQSGVLMPKRSLTQVFNDSTWDIAATGQE